MKRREIEIIIVEDKNVNQFYDPSRMNNGGGVLSALYKKGNNTSKRKNTIFVL